jgi:glycogen(starch) synthase
LRILVISNFYPPYALGGQGQSCHQVVTGLQSKGHQVVVLTSNHGINRTYEDVGEIHRELYLEMDLVRWRHFINFFLASSIREKHNLQYLRGLIKEFRPDIIFIWGMWNLSRSIDLPTFGQLYQVSTNYIGRPLVAHGLAGYRNEQ